MEWPGRGVNFWASENLSGRVHFEGYSPEWRVLSKLSVQPCLLSIKKYAAVQNIGNKLQVRNVFKLKTQQFFFTHFILLLALAQEIFKNMLYPGLSESLEVDRWVDKVSGQSRDSLFRKRHL